MGSFMRLPHVVARLPARLSADRFRLRPVRPFVRPVPASQLLLASLPVPTASASAVECVADSLNMLRLSPASRRAAVLLGELTAAAAEAAGPEVRARVCVCAYVCVRVRVRACAHT